MTSKTHCSVCTKKLRKNQRVLPCSLCRCNSHLKCSNISPSKFNTMRALNFESYECRKCSPTITTSKHVRNYLGSLADKDIYHSITNVNEKLNCDSKGDLFVLHLNIVSLVLYRDEIAHMLSRMKVQPDVICVSESKLKDDKSIGN